MANDDQARVVLCEFEDDVHRGRQLIAWVQLGSRLVKYRIDSSRSWKPIQGAFTGEQQRSADEALWAYLRDFTGEIDRKLLTRVRASG